MDESKGKNDEGSQDEPQELPPKQPLMQLLQGTLGRIARTPGRRLPGMRLREKEPEDAYMEREADLLEENEGHDRREKQEEGEGDGCCRLGARQQGGPCGGTVGWTIDYAD